MARTHTFKASADSYGYGYYGFIENNELVLVESWPREGGEIYRGSFANATKVLRGLKDYAPKLYSSIMEYYTKNQESYEITLSMLQPGDKFIRVSDNDPNFKDNTEYMLIDMDISKCFVFGDKMACFAPALDLETYKVFCFNKTSKVKRI